jgi:hypothetical protein
MEEKIEPQAGQRRSRALSSEEPFHRSEGLALPETSILYNPAAQQWNSDSIPLRDHFRYNIWVCILGQVAGKVQVRNRFSNRMETELND